MKINTQAVKSPKGKLEPFSYEREIGPQDVLISIKYATIAGGDVCFIDNLWNDTVYPLVPSSEIFGVIEEVGSNVTDLKIGDFVAVGYQMSSCFECEYCKEGKEQFCQKQKVLQVNGFGGLADKIVSDSRFTFKVPEKLQKPDYVPLICSGLTPYSAIKASGVESGMNVGLVGIGNLGHIALQILNKMGCEVTVFSHSKSKEEILKKLGAQKFVDSLDVTELEKLKGQFDMIFSTSSANLDWASYIKALKPQGTLVLIGIPAENISFHSALLADYAQRKILGSYYGSRAEMKEFLDFAAAQDIKPIVEVFPMSEANEVIDKVRRKEIPFSTVLQRN